MHLTRLDRIPPYDEEHVLRVVIEAPKGSVLKLKFEPRIAALTVSRSLPLGLAYPFDWGFVPGTLAEDGDPVDALVLNDQPSYPGIVMPCRILGVVELDQRDDKGKRQRNDRLVLAPNQPNAPGKWEHAGLPPSGLRTEIERFFLNAAFFTSKDPKILGWKGSKAAAELVARGVRMFKRRSSRRRG